MPEWLRNSFQTSEHTSIESVIARLMLALLCGMLVAGIYAYGRGARSSRSPTMPTTLVLLSVLIALVTLVIGDSVARAFGLVGALSIVRFRTVVEDARDTAFVMFAVVVGMAIGSGHSQLALLGMPVVVAAVTLMRLIQGGSIGSDPFSAILELRIDRDRRPEDLMSHEAMGRAEKLRLQAMRTAGGGAAYHLEFIADFSDAETIAGIVGELSQLPGVRGVEIRPRG